MRPLRSKGTKRQEGFVGAGTTERVVGQNLRPLRHPYFSEYEPLRELCLRILRRDALKYGNAADAIHGVLFDGAWLWEEYLATVLKGFEHPKNKTKENGIPFFEKGQGHRERYPDFYNKACVLDAKYKGKKSVSDDRNDLFQIVAYLHVLALRKGGFIVPAPERGDFESTRRTLAGTGGELALFRLAVPQSVADLAAFRKGIEAAETRLREEILCFSET